MLIRNTAMADPLLTGIAQRLCALCGKPMIGFISNVITEDGVKVRKETHPECVHELVDKAWPRE